MTNSEWLINQCALRVSLKSSTQKAKEWTYSRWEGARCSSVVERPLMVIWVVRSIPHSEPIELFLFEAVFHDWCNKGHSMYYPVWGMVNIKYILIVNIKKNERLMLIVFPLLLCEWSFIYVIDHITVNKMCWMRRLKNKHFFQVSYDSIHTYERNI